MKSFGRVIIRTKGLNVEKFLNIISSKAKLYNIDRKEKSIFLVEVDSFYKKTYIKQAQKYGLKTEVIRYKGFYKVFYFITQRFVFFVTILFMLSLYIFSNCFLWKININGNEYISRQMIVDVLYDSNISIGRIKGHINTKEVENILLENFKDIALVSVSVFGNSLNINISEKLQSTYMEYKPIMSDYNGIVKEIVLQSGTPLVKVGDRVSKGQQLVLPYIIDSLGDKKNINARAKILLEVDFSYIIEYNKNREIFEDTGEKLVFSNYSIFGLKLKNDDLCPYENYRKHELVYNIFEGNFIPIKKTVTTYYKQTKKQVIITFEECQEEVVAEAYKGLLSGAGQLKLYNQSHKIVYNESLVYVTAYAKALVSIGG